MLELIDSQQCSLAVSAIDAKGAPATVQNPVWASTDATVLVVTVDATDPMKANAVAGLPGVAQVKVTADADLGDGVKEISATLDVSVIGGEATGFTITAGAPVAQ